MRPGAAADVAALQALVAEAASEEGARQHLRTTAASAAADFAAGTFAFLVAKIDDEVAAVLIYYLLWDVCRCAPYMYLDDLCVSSRYRRRGLAGRLVEAAMERGRECGALALDFQVLHDNSPSLQLFRKLGAEFLHDFVNVSLSGSGLARVADPAFAPAAAGMLVRTAEDRDCGAVAALIRELAEHEGQGANVASGGLPQSCEGLVPCCLVAELHPPLLGGGYSGEPEAGGGIVGVVIMVPCYASWSGRRVVLSALVVTARMRRRGLGCALVQAACRHTAGLGVDMLQWAAIRSSEDAMAFYEKRLGAAVNMTGDWLDGSLSLQ